MAGDTVSHPVKVSLIVLHNTKNKKKKKKNELVQIKQIKSQCKNKSVQIASVNA